uniref:MBL fold metallo-hydrolase n=1 Tax=Schlesneria paludicola TaxID=360056 RepID=A0A7C4LQU9_9PLAN
MREVAPNVWLIESRLPYVVNAYLVGDTLVDCATRHASRRFARELGGRSLARIVLTHAHADHQGLAYALSTRWGIPVYCHEADLPVLRGEVPDPNRSWSNRLLSPLFAGPPCPHAEPLTPVLRFGGFRMVHLPGHTAGSVVFFRDADGVCLCGDVILSVWLPGLGARALEPSRAACDDWRENRRSIRLLWELQPRLLLPGHGPPIENPPVLDRLAEQLRRLEPAPCPAP